MVVGAPSGKLSMFIYKVANPQLSETRFIFRELFFCLNKKCFLCKIKFNMKSH